MSAASSPPSLLLSKEKPPWGRDSQQVILPTQRVMLPTQLLCRANVKTPF